MLKTASPCSDLRWGCRLVLRGRRIYFGWSDARRSTLPLASRARAGGEFGWMNYLLPTICAVVAIICYGYTNASVCLVGTNLAACPHLRELLLSQVRL